MTYMIGFGLYLCLSAIMVLAATGNIEIDADLANPELPGTWESAKGSMLIFSIMCLSIWLMWL